MQRNAVDIDVAARVPVLIRVEVHISGYRFAVDRHGVERMRQRTIRPVERIRVAVCAACELNGDTSWGSCTDSGLKRYIHMACPFVKGPHNFALHRVRWHFSCQTIEKITQMRHMVGIEIPSVSDVRILRHRTCGCQHAGTGIHIGGAEQSWISRKYVSDLIALRKCLQLRESPPEQSRATATILSGERTLRPALPPHRPA